MQKITHATAKRAGGRITVRGIAEGGVAIRVVNVDTIKFPGDGTVIATDKDGVEYALATAF